MRDRASLILFLFFILLLIILAQNGALATFWTNLSNGGLYNTTPLPTVRPLVFTSPTPRNQVLPPPNLPTAMVPPVYVPTDASQPQPPQTSGQATIPAGSVSSGGQCVVPNGWVPYTIQPGDTLAVIASNYNLTVQQLAAANCLDNPDLIFEGQVIAVPGTQ